VLVTKWTFCGILFSGALHAGAFAALERPFADAPSRPISTTVLFTVDPGSPEPETPEPPAAVEAPPRAAEAPERANPRQNPLPEEPDPAPPPPPPADGEQVADLTGITLTCPSGAGWHSATGDGSSRAGPLRGLRRSRAASASTVAPRGPARGASRPPATLRVLPAADLSSPPRPPNLDGALHANYPGSARAAGVSGLAVVRARISPSGVAKGLGIVSESAPGFGSACLRTVSGSVWSAPLDRDGHPVSTEIQYRCRFRVQR
jgi:outer membrane biosynthesis protein TonB